jgi:hypothetical protein
MSNVSIEFINILIALLVLYPILYRGLISLAYGVFVYASLHFLYSLKGLFSYDELVNMHTGSADVVVKITGIIFMIFVFLQLNWRYLWQVFNDKRMAVYFCVAMSLVLIGFVINSPTTVLQVQNLLSIEAMLMLLWLMSVGFKVDSAQLKVELYHLKILNVIIASALLIAFVEVFYHLSWARYGYQEQVLFRASSFLFNPNLFGMWSAMLYLGLSFLFHRDDSLPKKTILLGLFLLSGSLYLSGSRSFIYLLILMLILLLPLIKGKTVMQLVTPLAIVLSTFFAISGFSGLIAAHSKSDVSSGWQSVELVGERILAAPIDAIKYGVITVGKEITVDKEIAIAIEGRFKGNSRDSGILRLYDDFGWLGLFAVVWLGLVFLVWASKVYLVKSDVTSAYALVMLLFCGGIGISMGYLVFPVWVFIAIAVSPCLALWRTVLINVDKQSKINESSVAKL